MLKPQLGFSLYELACVWAKAQMEQSGMTCTTEHLVYFLTEIFKNIAEELVIEVRQRAPKPPAISRLPHHQPPAATVSKSQNLGSAF